MTDTTNAVLQVNVRYEYEGAEIGAEEMLAKIRSLFAEAEAEGWKTVLVPVFVFTTVKVGGDPETDRQRIDRIIEQGKGQRHRMEEGSP